MGEAKRRQTAERNPQYRDLVTGELRPARDGGDVETYLNLWGSGERPPVPCGGCTKCCYHPKVDVHPDRERPEDLPFLATETDSDGRVWLRKRADGACIHLGEGGCTIHEHRPQSCRRYDCRVYSLFGVLDQMDGGRYTPMWAFRHGTQRSRVLLTAYQLAGRLAAAELKREGKPLCADAVATRGFVKVPGLVQFAEEMSRVPLKEWGEKFGVDPVAMTAETHAQTLMNMVKALGLADLPRTQLESEAKV